MSLLTKEQLNTVENMRNDMDSILPLNDNSLSPDDSIIAYQAALNLLDVIDDLQARAPKQYTDQELSEWAREPWMSDYYFEAYFEGVRDFAGRLGALKTEP